MKIILLGAGLVGGPMAIDLVKEKGFDVSVVDISKESLDSLKNHESIRCICDDLSQPARVKELVRDQDLVLCAMPGHMGFGTVRAVIEAGKDIVDISFFSENPFDLDELAKEKEVTAICDMGVAPGMSNVLVGYISEKLDRTDKVRIYVGGLPKVREWPWEYKAVFSPIDVIEEYTRPARLIEDGKVVIKPALSESELIHFPDAGTLEAFNSDGLRTLIYTINAPDMVEKTLRYKGHIEKIAVLRDTGFFSSEKIDINGTRISPLDLTARLLFPKWKMKKGDEDITVLKIIIEGMKNGKTLRYIYDLYDEYDRHTGIHSMARTTGYTATMAIRMLAKGMYKQKGFSPPEYISKDEACVRFIIDGLKERGVIYRESVIELKNSKIKV
jgi:saccharopine dehydrogenase-like NADP-dependent oxidoreductase